MHLPSRGPIFASEMLSGKVFYRDNHIARYWQLLTLENLRWSAAAPGTVCEREVLPPLGGSSA